MFKKIMTTKYLSTQRIKDAWGDGLKPYRCNWWFQLGIALLLASYVKFYDFYMSENDINDYGLGVKFFLAAAIILGPTQLGRGTLNSYQRAKRMIGHHGEFKIDIQGKFAEQLFCFRAGARAAAIELGVQKQLICSLANWWKPI